MRFGKDSRVVALHGGVTFRDSENAVAACKNVMKCSDGAVPAVENLELSGSFNAGRGSSLTRKGTVEMEAAVCRNDQSGFEFGAVGACSLLASPVRVAEGIASSRSEEDEYDLIDPMVLISDGAEIWAKKKGFEVFEEPVKSAESVKEWQRAIDIVNGASSGIDKSKQVMDTVGAVDLMDWSSTAACSSGGVILKRPGRLGHCTKFGAGVWVEDREWQESSVHRRRLVSICLTGCGEAIVRLHAAEKIAMLITKRCESQSIVEVISDYYKNEFRAKSRLLARVNPDHLYMGGIAIVREQKRETGPVPTRAVKELKIGESEDVNEVVDEEDESSLELVIFHNTPFLPVAWRDNNGKVRAMMSRGEAGKVTVTVLPL